MLLNGKSCYHILRPTAAFMLGHYALVAYSFLVRRSRLNISTSQRDLGDLTGFSPHTLVKVEPQLVDAGLVVRDGYNLVAQADTNGLFHIKKKKTKQWQDRYQTTIIYDLTPTAPLSSIENYILCTILSFNANGKIPTDSAIATLLCITERTVRDKVKRLRAVGLIDGDGFYVTIKDKSYWLDAEPKTKKDTLAIDQNCVESLAESFVGAFAEVGYQPQFIPSMADWQQVMRGHVGRMLRANYTEDDVWDFWGGVGELAGRKMPVIEKFAVQVFAELFAKAEYQTCINRSKGAFRGKNSLGLLNLWAKAVCADMLARYNHNADEFFAYLPDLSNVQYRAAG